MIGEMYGNKDPLVSIITPTYNCESTINATINSVVSQTYDNWEMIIIDDCSSDDTIKIVNDWLTKDNRITLIQLKTNSGASIARNHGMKIAHGKYVAFLDGDDTWSNNKLEKQIEFMMRNNLAMTYTPYYICDQSLKPLEIKKAPKMVDYRELLKWNRIGCLTVIIDIEKTGKHYLERIDKRNDYALWLTILRQGIIAFCYDEPLAYYRSHNGLSKGKKTSFVKYHYYLFHGILKYNSVISSYYTLRNIIYYFIYKF